MTTDDRGGGGDGGGGGDASSDTIERRETSRQCGGGAAHLDHPSSPAAPASATDANPTEKSIEGQPAANELVRRQEPHGGDCCPPPLLSLILPCPDGAFPYLTPHMLRTCFPAHQVPHLVLGIAVRDTCVVPAAARKEEIEDAKKEEPDGKGAGKKKATTNPRPAKNKGYTFASSAASNHQGGGSKVLVDPWLTDYRRLVVPTFDLWDDDKNDDSPNGPGVKTTNGSKAKGGSKPEPSSSAATSSVVSSNDRIWVKTPNGRLALSPGAYVGSALLVGRPGGSKEIIVPLFDAIPPLTTATTTKLFPSTSTATPTTASSSSLSSSSPPPTVVTSDKRKALAVQRCHNWYRQCRQLVHDEARQHPPDGGTSSPSSEVRVLAPVVLDPTFRPRPRGRNGDDEDDDDDDDDDDDLLHRQLLDLGADGSEFGGSVLIGWHALDSVQRRHAVQRWHEHQHQRRAAQPVAPTPPEPDGDDIGFQKKERAAAAVVVLKTKSLVQFLDATSLEHGAMDRSHVLVASDLPAVWSRNHKAFVLRLPPSSRPSQGDRNPTISKAPEKTRTEPAIGDSPNPKRLRIDPNSEYDNDTSGSPTKHGWLDENGCVNLSPHCDHGDDGSRHPWFRDASPVVRGCRCATCRHHTRAYIYHLVCAKELLGEVLLFVHNLHHVLALVDRINQCGGSTSDFVALTTYITDQLPPGSTKGYRVGSSEKSDEIPDPTAGRSHALYDPVSRTQCCRASVSACDGTKTTNRVRKACKRRSVRCLRTTECYPGLRCTTSRVCR